MIYSSRKDPPFYPSSTSKLYNLITNLHSAHRNSIIRLYGTECPS